MENNKEVFFNKLRTYTADNQFELISIHIPKTAGTSFFQALKEIYSSKEIIRLDCNQRAGSIQVNQKVFTQEKLPAKVKAVHGHFKLNTAIKTFQPAADGSLPIITWLRDPVDRVVSNYTYMAKRLAEELDEERKGLNILAKMQRSLLEYARRNTSKNLMARYLEGMELKDFKFVGIQEYYQEDLQYLAQLYNWPKVKEYKHNITGSTYELSEAEREELIALNHRDVALYQEALAIREERLSRG